MSKILAVVFALLCSLQSRAFTEMISHGYVSCTSCHASPIGGGALTDYGRELSRAMLSTWGLSKKDQYFLHGAFADVKKPKSIYAFGGDYRGVQIHQENKFIEFGEYIHMQADVEAVIQAFDFQAAFAAGRVERTDGVGPEIRKAYLMKKIGKKHVLRAGYFRPRYGLNIPDHNTLIKDTLGFGLDSEGYALEYSWITKKWGSTLTAQLPNNHIEKSIREDRLLGTLTYAFNKYFQVGLNGGLAESDTGKRQVVGLHSRARLFKNIYSLFEADLNFSYPDNENLERGAVAYWRLGYEVYQGIHLLGLHEWSRSDTTEVSSQRYSYGLGLTWYPIPHIELHAAWNKVQIKSMGDDWGDAAWLMVHYYL